MKLVTNLVAIGIEHVRRQIRKELDSALYID